MRPEQTERGRSGLEVRSLSIKRGSIAIILKLCRRAAVVGALLSVALPAPAFAADGVPPQVPDRLPRSNESVPEVPARLPRDNQSFPQVPDRLPNPFKQTAAAPVSITEDLKAVEQILYGEANEDISEERRLAALERTVFGASYANAKLSLATRAAGLSNVAKHLAEGRKLFAERRWKEAKTEFDEVMRLLGKEWKSLVKAEVHYRLGVCEYELSNVSQAAAPNPAVKTNGALLRSAQENLLRAQDYYKSLGQPETALKISKFIDTFKEKAAHYYLY